MKKVIENIIGLFTKAKTVNKVLIVDTIFMMIFIFSSGFIVEMQSDKILLYLEDVSQNGNGNILSIFPTVTMLCLLGIAFIIFITCIIINAFKSVNKLVIDPFKDDILLIKDVVNNRSKK